MYYPDLAHYEYDYGLDRPKPLRRTIGWLDAEHDYPKGEVEADVLERLWAFCQNTPDECRTYGFHECEFCSDGALYWPARRGDQSLKLGTAEIRVTGKNGRVYVAPDLIYHYIVDHHYLPPAEFIEAVRQEQPVSSGIDPTEQITMHHPDLSPCMKYEQEEHRPVLNIGWLHPDHRYAKGKVSAKFIRTLWHFFQRPAVITMGTVECKFCAQSFSGRLPQPSAQTWGVVGLEIYVPGRNGIYVAPSLLYHYVVDHHYQPPAEFMEAVLQYSHLFEQSAESASLEQRGQKPNPFSRMIRMVTNLLSS